MFDSLPDQSCQAIVANLEHEEWAARQFPPEEDLEEFPEDFDDDPFEEEDEEEEEAETSEEEIEEIGERKIESEEELEEEEEDPEDVVALQEDEDQEVEETDDVKPTIPKCKGFLACLETDHTAWARENMRPWTPPSRRPTVSSPKAMWPESPKVSALHRPRLGRQATLWARTGSLDDWTTGCERLLVCVVPWFRVTKTPERFEWNFCSYVFENGPRVG